MAFVGSNGAFDDRVNLGTKVAHGMESTVGLGILSTSIEASFHELLDGTAFLRVILEPNQEMAMMVCIHSLNALVRMVMLTSHLSIPNVEALDLFSQSLLRALSLSPLHSPRLTWHQVD